MIDDIKQDSESHEIKTSQEGSAPAAPPSFTIDRTIIRTLSFDDFHRFYAFLGAMSAGAIFFILGWVIYMIVGRS